MKLVQKTLTRDCPHCGTAREIALPDHPAGLSACTVCGTKLDLCDNAGAPLKEYLHCYDSDEPARMYKTRKIGGVRYVRVEADGGCIYRHPSGRYQLRWDGGWVAEAIVPLGWLSTLEEGEELISGAQEANEALARLFAAA